MIDLMTLAQLGFIKAYHINQRNEGIDLGSTAGALMATSNLQMQTFVAGFSAGAGASAGGNNVPLVGEQVFCITGNAIDREPENGGNGIGYQEDVSYTLTGFDRHAVFRRQWVDAFTSDEIAGT